MTINKISGLNMESGDRVQSFARIARTIISCAVLGAFCSSASAADCEDYTAVHIEGKSGLPSDTKYLEVRTQLLDSLLADAVARVNGAQVSAREASRLSEVNGELDSSYDALSMRAVKGLIKSYSFAPDGEAVISDPNFGNMLTMALDVVVCDRSVTDTVYVALGDIAFQQFEDFTDAYLSEFIRAAIPSKSNLRLLQSVDETGFYDYIITGKVLNIATTAENSMLMAFIGNAVRTGNGKPIVDSRQYRMSATVALRAENAIDKSYTVVTHTVEKKLSAAVGTGDALAQRIDEFSGEAVGEVAGMLFEKIVNQEDFRKPFQRD